MNQSIKELSTILQDSLIISKDKKTNIEISGNNFGFIVHYKKIILATIQKKYSGDIEVEIMLKSFNDNFVFTDIEDLKDFVWVFERLPFLYNVLQYWTKNQEE